MLKLLSEIQTPVSGIEIVVICITRLRHISSAPQKTTIGITSINASIMRSFVRNQVQTHVTGVEAVIMAQVITARIVGFQLLLFSQRKHGDTHILSRVK